ncbi:MAG: response regulator [Gammaproteobacteria bacterium]|nr:response regulator [Gammaproteobacteria bacterium]NIR84279.1 response regulator [Gammaproteobacteria bacterium]NIR89749.1 response regulator [Gammaproteobacteria bacterium]NIU05437.1 response regulator [Gammaproteobacteria bacterium]NIV52383.1 response regulator [Gammaproteobacteria bacterium]
MRAGGVGGRLGIAGAALTLVVALCLVAWATATRFQRLDDDLRRAGAESARDFAALALQAMRLANEPALQTLARTIVAAPGVRSATIFSPQGRPVARAGRRLPGPAPASTRKRASFGESTLDGYSLLVNAPLADRQTDRGKSAAGPGPRRSANARGWVQLELSRAATRRAQTRVIVEGLAAALLLLAIAATFARRRRRKSHQPSWPPAGSPASVPVPATPPGGTARSGAPPRVDAAAGLEKALYHERLRAPKLERARRRAAATHRMNSKWLAKISHEIRTPMSGVLGYCNLLLKTRLNPAQLEFARTIQSCTESLLGVVGAVLDSSRTEAEVFRQEATEFDLRVCVEDVLALFAPSAYAKDLQLVCLVSPYVPLRVRGNPDGIRHILINLVSNAIKYTDRGSVVVRVTLTGQDGAGLTTLFSITDTGPGIDEHCRRGLFKAFNRAGPKAVYVREGTGLGLAICKEIVQSLGGEIGVESTPGCGSTFWFTVHCEKCGCSPASAVKPLEGRHALVYGRAARERSALREMLISWGMQVDEARTLGELAAQLETPEGRPAPHDVVILDLSQHRQHKKRVKDVRARCDKPVVTILNAAEHEAACLLGSTVSACLFKPVRYHELQATLKRLVEGCRRGTRDAAPPAPRVPEEPRAVSTGLRVLLADDDEVCRRLLVLLLHAGGVRVSLACDGHEAVNRALGGRFDVILMDLYMPGLDGLAAAQRIRAAEGTGQRTPIIALTADAGLETRRRLLARGMDDCLVKPVSEGELWQTLHHHARRERACDAFPANPHPATAALERELHSLLLAELPARRSRINDALERADVATIGFEAHALVGAAAYCAVPALKQAGDALERAAEFGRMSAVTRRVRRLNVEIDQLLSAGTRAVPGAATSATQRA